MELSPVIVELRRFVINKPLRVTFCARPVTLRQFYVNLKKHLIQINRYYIIDTVLLLLYNSSTFEAYILRYGRTVDFAKSAQ